MVCVTMVSEKKIVDEVSGWLTLYDDGSVDRTWRGPPEFAFIARPVPPHEEFVDGVATRDVTIDKNSGLAVRLYLPERRPGDEEKLPILLHFHGGGFCISQADWFMYYNIYTRLVRSARVVCVSVYLRRAPENKLPAACEDGYSTLLWLRSVALGESTESWLEAHADFGRVVLIGDSSGGNLVHDVAARAGGKDFSPVRVSGGIPIHPGFVRKERSKSELEPVAEPESWFRHWLEQPETPFLTLDMADKFLAFALPIGSDKDHPLTCPMGANAPPLSELKLPPIMLVVAGNDLIKDTELEYCEEMKKAGKEVELFINPGMTHSFYLNKIAIDTDPETAEETNNLILAIRDFIKRH